MAFESWYKQTLAAKLNPWDTSLKVSIAPTITKGRIYLKSGDQEEWIWFTGVSWTTLTWLTRQLSKTGSPATSQGSWFTWIAWTPVRIVAMHDQIADLQELLNANNTFNGDNTYNGKTTLNGTFEVNWVLDVKNTGEIKVEWKSIPYPVVADTTERDALYTTPTWWEAVYVQGENALQIYNAWTSQWEALDVWTPTPQATESSTGTVRYATQTEANESDGVWVIQASKAPVMYGNFVFKNLTIDWNGEIEMDWNDLCYELTPDNNFTLKAWSSLRPGTEYVLRVHSQNTLYSMTLWTGVSNPFGDSLIFKENKDTTLVFFATSASTLELWTIRTAL